MKILQVLVCVAAVGAITSCAVGTVPREESVVTDIELSHVDKLVAQFEGDFERGIPVAAELGRLQGQDRYIKDLIISYFKNEKFDTDAGEIEEFVARTSWIFEKTNREATLGLKKILETVSWDELVAMNPLFVDDAFHIVQHSDDEVFRQQTLPELKRLAEEGKVDQQKYALMYDRSTLEQGGMQIYGTQMRCQGGDRKLLKPHADIAEIAKNRLDLNMEPYEVYKERDNELYGACSS